MTQKDLAEKLNVTFQAVSRWENEDVEPSFDTLKQIAEIFHCSIDDLFGMRREEAPKPEAAPVQQVVERVVVQEARPVLALCERCNDPIYEKEDIVRKTVTHGRGASTDHIYCKKCDNLLKQEAIRKEKERQLKYRTRSLIWPTIVAVLFFAGAIYMYATAKVTAGHGLLALGVMFFTFLGCVFLNNNFVEEMWETVSEWGFISLPGVIFEFSLDGIIIGLLIKLFLGILWLILAISATLLATVLALFVSVFVYPFALIKNLKATK